MVGNRFEPATSGLWESLAAPYLPGPIVNASFVSEVWIQAYA